jgi:hypothetical protein
MKVTTSISTILLVDVIVESFSPYICVPTPWVKHTKTTVKGAPSLGNSKLKFSPPLHIANAQSWWLLSPASSEVYPACLRPSPNRSCQSPILIQVSTRTPLSAKSGLPCNLSMLDLRCRVSASHPTKVHVLRTWPKLLSILLVLSLLLIIAYTFH